MSKNVLTEMLSEGWLYRGEGNANLAIFLPTSHQILRLPKTDPTKSSNVEHIENKCLEFYNSIIIPLLGNSYAEPASEVSTTKEEIQKLNQELFSLRPEYRKHKELGNGLATLWMDYAFLPKELDVDSSRSVFAVEIKPKQGWCPIEEQLYDKCQFCLNQYLKLQNNQIKKISSYCPVELFSGIETIMVKALRSLISDAQNNFKIFRNGVYTYGDNTSIEVFDNILSEIFETKYSSTLMDNFCNLIQNVLVTEFYTETCVQCNEFKEPYQDHKLQNTDCSIKSNLPKGCVLNRILQLQRLNLFGLKKYYEFSQTLVEKNTNIGMLDYVEKALQVLITSKCITCEMKKLNEEEFTNELNLLPYLIASVAYDCSLMVTFQKVNRFEGVSDKFLINVANSTFLINVKVLDLYPKNFNTFEKHMKRNLKVYNAYRNYKK